MINLFNKLFMLMPKTVSLLDATNSAEALCEDLKPLLRLVGIVLLAIKIVVPIILIVIGMIELAKAVGDEDKVSKATEKLVQKLIIAVLVFLVATIVGIVMRLIGGSQYKLCTTCLNDPFGCPVISEMQYD